MVFGLWKRRKDMTPFAFYQSVMDQARQPAFFTQFGVPDTISGRFDLLVAHAILLFRRLGRVQPDRTEEAAARSQAFSDVLFKDLDRALRDTGVSDRNVPKRLKTLTSAYLGRGKAFGEALDAGDLDGLAQALERNTGGIIFAADGKADPDGEDMPSADFASLAHYLQSADRALAEQSDDDVLSASLAWPAAQLQKAS